MGIFSRLFDRSHDKQERQERKEQIERIASVVDDVAQKLENLEIEVNNIKTPIIERIDQHDNKTSEHHTELLQQLGQLLQQLPTDKQTVITVIADLNENLQKVVNLFLKQEYPDYLTFAEIGEALNMPESSVRGYISALEKSGYSFDRIKTGHKVKIKLKDELLQQLLTKRQLL